MGGLTILGLKNKGEMGSKFAGFKGDFFGLREEGGYFPGGGLDFKEGNALFWHWIVPIFKKYSTPAGYFTLI